MSGWLKHCFILGITQVVGATALLDSSWGADRALECLLSKNGSVLNIASAPTRENQAVTRPVESSRLDFDFEGSLSPGNFIVTLQDRREQLRTAFSAGYVSAAGAGSTLRQGDVEMGCRLIEEGRPLTITPAQISSEIPKHMVCFLDVATIRGGQTVSNDRVFSAVTAANRTDRPAEIRENNGQVGYSAYFDFQDASKGLRLKVSNLKSGKETSYEGSANSFVRTVLFAMTEGDREKDADIIRLGCQLL